MFTFTFILFYTSVEVNRCLCVQGDIYWSYFFACVQLRSYWADGLLMCISTIIELLFCWYADLLLLIYVFACVHFYLYRDLFCLCAKVKLLRNSFAYVQYEYYSVPPLLRCNHLLTCRKTLIDTISCLCATRWLLNISFAYVQLSNYRVKILLVCSCTVIEV